MVLLIVSLVMGTVLPRIGAGWKNLEEREFVQDFARTITRARLQAMNTGNIAVFRIRGGGERVYGLDNPPEQPIPPNVDVYSDDLEEDPDTGDHIIVFYPDGSPSGGEIDVIFDKERTFYLSVHPLTGAVTWSRANKD
jgi:general secretion pathway protein H